MNRTNNKIRELRNKLIEQEKKYDKLQNYLNRCVAVGDTISINWEESKYIMTDYDKTCIELKWNDPVKTKISIDNMTITKKVRM